VGGYSATFVGREAELAAVLELGARVRRLAGPAALLVIGDPGSGKSRLLAEACARTTVARQFHIVGFDAARQVPLSAASDLLRTLTVAPGDGQRLHALLYEDQVAAGGLQPLRIFEAAHRALCRIAPALIVLDDLQWFDEQTVALCHYLMRGAKTSNQPIGLIVGSRPSPTTDALAVALQQLLPAGSMSTLSLKSLSRDEGTLLATKLAPGLPRGRAEALWLRASGSPFWIEALVHGTGADHDPGDIVSARLRGLPAASAAVFAVLSVAGRPLAPRDLATLLSWDAGRIENAAAQLVNRGVVVQLGAGLALAHDLIRETALRQLPGHERRRIHRQLAAWLEAAAGDDIGTLGLALEHRRGGAVATVDLALRLARAPNRALLGGDGLRLLGEIADHAEPRAEQTGVLEQHVAALALELGEWSVALDRFVRLSERLPDELERGRAAYGAATAAYALRRADEARTYLTRCVETDDALLAIEAEALEAQTLGWLQARTHEGKALAAHAAASAHKLVATAGGIDRVTVPERRAVVAALGAAFDAALWNDDIVEMLDISDVLIEAGRTVGDVALNATLDGYYSLLPLARFREAEARFGGVLEEARRRVLPAIIARASFYLSAVLFIRGRFGQARTHATEFVELADRGVLPARYPQTHGRGLLFAIAASESDWRQELAGLAELLEREPKAHMRNAARMELLRWLARLGGVDQISRQLAVGMDDVEESGCERCRSEMLLVAVEACARIGRRTEAREFAASWDTRHPDPYPYYRMQRQHAEALLAAGEGDVRTALPLLEAVRMEAEEVGAAREELWVRLDVGECLASSDRQRGIATLHTVAATAGALGSGSARERAEQSLRALGVRTWRRTRATRDEYASRLSDREREILRLVAEGASNPEIASSVFLSRKTVERHISNILRKVGVRNRTELVAAVGQVNEGVHP